MSGQSADSGEIDGYLALDTVHIEVVVRECRRELNCGVVDQRVDFGECAGRCVSGRINFCNRAEINAVRFNLGIFCCESVQAGLVTRHDED